MRFAPQSRVGVKFTPLKPKNGHPFSSQFWRGFRAISVSKIGKTAALEFGRRKRACGACRPLGGLQSGDAVGPLPVQHGLHPREIADVAAMDGIGVVTEVIVGELLQPFQFGVDGGGAGEVGVDGGLLGVHCGLRDVIDDATMNALFNLEAKLNSMYFRHPEMHLASNAGGLVINLINCALTIWYDFMLSISTLMEFRND